MYKCGFLTLICLVTAIAAQERSDVALTVYNNDRALVRESRIIPVSQGVSEIRIVDVPSRIDPTSVHFRPAGKQISVRLLEQNYEYDLASPERILDKYLNQELTVFTQQDGPFKGTLLHHSSRYLTLQMKDSRLKIINMNSIIDVDCPRLPSGLIARPTLVWLVEGESSGTYPAEISYLTRGVSWHAEYVTVVSADDKTIDLNAWVSIDNKSGASYPNARLKLVAGDVHTISPPIRPMAEERMLITSQAKAAPQFKEKSFFEYHMYTLQRQTTIQDNQIKQIQFIPPTQTHIVKKYEYNGQRDKDNVRSLITFKNSTSKGLGLPLPAGTVRVYKADPDDPGSLEFIGEDRIEHTPVDEQIHVFIGYAFDLKAERKQISVKRLSDRSRKATYRIQIRNHKKESVAVTVVEKLYGTWEITSSTLPYHKKDARTIEFELKVKGSGEKSVEYTVFYQQ